MSEHKVTVDWKRETPDFAYETYNRDHDWTFDSGSPSEPRPQRPRSGRAGRQAKANSTLRPRVAFCGDMTARAGEIVLTRMALGFS
jgi:hypothetical protein